MNDYGDLRETLVEAVIESLICERGRTDTADVEQESEALAVALAPRVAQMVTDGVRDALENGGSDESQIALARVEALLARWDDTYWCGNLGQREDLRKALRGEDR